MTPNPQQPERKLTASEQRLNERIDDAAFCCRAAIAALQLIADDDALGKPDRRYVISALGRARGVLANLDAIRPKGQP